MSELYPNGQRISAFMADQGFSQGAYFAFFYDDGTPYVYKVGDRIVIDEMQITQGDTQTNIAVFWDTDGSGEFGNVYGNEVYSGQPNTGVAFTYPSGCPRISPPFTAFVFMHVTSIHGKLFYQSGGASPGFGCNVTARVLSPGN